MSPIHKFLFVGDVVLNSRPYLSKEIESLFHESVIRSCNVEAPLRGFGYPVEKTGPHVDQDPRAATWLQTMGFNMFSLANNHICDFGAEGLRATQQAFHETDILGVGQEEEAYNLHIKELGGIRYGFVAYGENGYGALNGDTDMGYAWLNHPRVDKDIKAYKENVDVLIVQIHCGVEMLDVPLPEWRQRCYELIDAGADVIVGHHPHVLQGIEIYKDRPICYSLGNFCFDYPNHHPQWNTGGLLQLTMEKGRLIDCHLHVVERTGQHIRLWDNHSSTQKTRELNAKLQEPNYSAYIDREVLKLWQQHHVHYYATAVNGLVSHSIVGVLKHIKRLLFRRKIDRSMLWHNLFIESNIWLVKRAIRQLNKK